MKHRKLLIYLFPFVLTAITYINNPYQPIDLQFRAINLNIYQWVLSALEIAFGGDNTSTILQYMSWLVTYSIVFEFCVIIIKLVVFLPKLMESFIDKILGGKFEKV